MSTLGRVAETVSAARGSAPGELRRLFRNELDWIVMKALEKDRNRRARNSRCAGGRRAALHERRAVTGVPAIGVVSLLANSPDATAARWSRYRCSVWQYSVGIGALAVSTVLVWEANMDLKHSLERERIAAERERRDAYSGRISVRTANCPSTISSPRCVL